MTNFHANGMPKEGCRCISLSVILSDSVFKKVFNICVMRKYIDDDLKILS